MMYDSGWPKVVQVSAEVSMFHDTIGTYDSERLPFSILISLSGDSTTGELILKPHSR